MNSNNNYNPTRSKSELNKSFNKKSQVNSVNQNDKEKELKNLEIYELVKFEESLVKTFNNTLILKNLLKY